MKIIISPVAIIALASTMTQNVDANEVRSFDFTRFSDLEQTGSVTPSRVSSGSEEGAEQEFTIGGGGILTTENRVIEDYYSRIANLDVPTSSWRGSAPQADGYVGELHSDKSHAQVSTDRCGPSPLGPAAIRDLVVAAADKHGVDRSLATAVAWTESRFDRVRNSPKGARGAMQLMPATAQRYGVRDVCDPTSNIDGGVRYLRSLIDEFGNPLLAAAAYNAGEQSIYAYHGVPPFRETVAYVAAILNYQLGLPTPGESGGASRQGDGERSPTQSNSVIGATTAATFVGGVMQF